MLLNMPPYCKNCGRDLPGNPGVCPECGWDQDAPTTSSQEKQAEPPLAVYRASSLSTPVGLRIYRHEIEVTQPGLIKHTAQRVRYEHIAQVVVRGGLLLSTLLIETTGGHTIAVRAMEKASAEAARAAIQERMRTTFSGGSTSAPLSTDIPAQIRALADLKEAGIISEEEFESKKTELLGRM